MDKTVDKFKKDLQNFLEEWDSLVQESITETGKEAPKIFADTESANIAWRMGFYEGKKQMLQQIAEHFKLIIPSMEKDTN